MTRPKTGVLQAKFPKKDYPFRSLFFGRRFLYPHLRHIVARGALRALQRMQIFLSRRRASASGKRAIIALTLVLFSSLYVTLWSINSLVQMAPQGTHPTPKTGAAPQEHAPGVTSSPSLQASVQQTSCHPRRRWDHTQTLPLHGG